MRIAPYLALLAFLLAAGPIPGARAQAAGFLAPDPGFAELGAVSEPMDLPGLERAALLASGLKPEELDPYESRLDRIIREAGAAADKVPTAMAKAESVLSYLHGGALRSYREDATTIDGILDTGLYNCVSSAVLYLLAVRALGIDGEGARTSDHAFCTVLIDGRSVDVETTNPYGFDPGGKKEFTDSFGRVTGYAYVAPGGYGDRRAIGGRELVGLILSNRASELELSGRFAEATRLGADYAALCPGADSRAFLVDRVNNLVASLESRRDYAGAEAAAQAAAASLPGEARLAALARTASYNRAVALAQSGDWDAAFQAALRLAAASPGDTGAKALVAGSLSGLAQSYARKGDFAGARAEIAERAGSAGPAAAAEARAAVGEIELVGAAKGLPLAEAVAAADRIFAAGEVGPSRYAQAVAAIYGNEAGRMGAGGDWLGGAALADRGGAKLGGAKLGGAEAEAEGSLARLAQTLRHNFVADAHNRFARLYNSGDYAGAKASLAAALVSMPGDETLTRDLAAADAAMAN
jgi:hypothetical protein